MEPAYKIETYYGFYLTIKKTIYIRMKKTIFYFICFAFSFSLTAQRSYYVKPDGMQSGSSWRLASGDLQSTIEKASAGDNIYVAVGTYSGGFVMKEGVQVKGGYTANINDPTERYNLTETTDPAKQSILDGGGVQRVLTQYASFSIPTAWEGFVVQNGCTSFEYKIGSLIYSSFGDSEIVGILYKYDVKSGQGMMFGVKEIGKQWGAYGTELSGLPICDNQESARNDRSGFTTAEIILSTLGDQCLDFSEDSYPRNGNYAAYWCDTLTTGGYTNWYLPSSGELQDIYDANINPIMRRLGKNPDYGYWTGSQAGSILAWAYYFGNDQFHPALKYITHTVSAVCPFTAPEQRQDSIISTAGGGAFLCENGILKNCIIKNNQSPSRGGGVYVGKGGKLDNCIVDGNDAPEGKEIYYEIPTGLISPLNETDAFNIYPNPVKAGERITIVPNVNESIRYRFFNAYGAVVKEGTSSTGKQPLTVPSQRGIYLLQLQSNHNNYKAKIIVN